MLLFFRKYLTNNLLHGLLFILEVSTYFANFEMVAYIVEPLLYMEVPLAILSTAEKKTFLRTAIESDSFETVQLVHNLFNNFAADDEIINLAKSRGNCKIINCVDPSFKISDQDEEKSQKKEY